MIDVHPLKPDSAEELIERMRQPDRFEIFGLGWSDIRSGVEFSIEASDECFEARDVDGALLAIFGVAAPGCPWMLGTERLDAELPRLTLVRIARKWVRNWLERYGQLSNIVGADNHRSIEWLRVLGFEIGEPLVIEPTKSLFVPFGMQKET